MYYIYILHLIKTNKLYTGSTSILKRRLLQHSNNGVISTRHKNPELIHYECYKLKSDAQRREKFLKTTEGKRLLKQQLRDILTKINDPGSSSGRTSGSGPVNLGSNPSPGTKLNK